ncbi:MAG: hypothetical protein WCD43_09570 [Candidatus Acidiferrales bacterium]
MNRKGYVRTWATQENARGRYFDYWFTSNPDKAAIWVSKDEADEACKDFKRDTITIRSSLGGEHICSGFKSEEHKPGKFVVFCEAPFIAEQPDASA